MVALKRIGYYRLSTYTYPFRLFVEEDPASVPDTFKSRSDQFAPGSTLDDALHLYAFDEKLRVLLLEGLNIIEIGLSVRVAYLLGKRDPLGHLDSTHLDEESCNAINQSSHARDAERLTEHEVWIHRYEKLKQDAKQEEFVKHHILKYDGNVPIWAAIEFLDFGCLVRLLNLMKVQDRQKISAELGLEKDRANQLFRWLKALNILRNHCAHSNRVWNRSTVDQPPKFATEVVRARLHHLNDLDNAKRLKLYYLAALVAYLVTEINPDSNWPRSFLTQSRKLGTVNGMTLESSMGFPEKWDTLPLWNYDPRNSQSP